MRKSTKLLTAAALACSTLMLTIPAASTNATGGLGLYKDSINWISFPAHNIGVTEGYSSSTTQHYGAYSVTTTCSINNIRAGTEDAAGNQLRTYRPGYWSADAFDNLYNIGGNGANNQLITGITNIQGRDNARPGAVNGFDVNDPTAEFDINCTAAVTNLDGSHRPLRLGGMVVADAESSSTYYTMSNGVMVPDSINYVWPKNPQWRQSEWIEITAPPTSTTHVIDGFRDTNCSTTSLQPDKSETPAITYLDPATGILKLVNEGRECKNGGPALVTYIDGADDIHVKFKWNGAGNGASAIAIGSILPADYGDAPNHYGKAVAFSSTDWTDDGLVEPGVVRKDWFNKTSSSVQGASKPNGSTLMLGSKVSFESNEYTHDANADHDDHDDATNNQPSWHEGTDPNTLEIHSTPGEIEARTISCTDQTGQGNIRGWIDYDRNGLFDDNEASSIAQCINNEANLEFLVPTDAQNGETFLRLWASQDTNDLASPIGVSFNGEVEDYKLISKVGALSLKKTSSSPPFAGAGDVITYSITVTNTGKGNFTNRLPAIVYDNPELVLNHMEYVSDSITATSGTPNDAVLTGANQLTNPLWQGPLSVGESAIISYQMRITDVSKAPALTNVVWGSTDTTPKPTQCETLITDQFGNQIDADTELPCDTTSSNSVEILKNVEGDGPAVPSDFQIQVNANGIEKTFPGSSTPNSKNAYLIPENTTLTISETNLNPNSEGYELASIQDENNTVLTNIVTSNPKQVILTNKPKTGAISWSKVTETNDLLANSQWTLTHENGARFLITDNTGQKNYSGLDTDPTPGKFTASPLNWGKWTLTETKAPAGYQKTDNIHEILLNGSLLTANIGNIKNDTAPGLTLPFAGGVSAQLLSAIGVILAVLSTATYAVSRKFSERNRK